MASLFVCDHGECPAVALRHLDIYGQDFHFCNHHFEELHPALTPYLELDGSRIQRFGEARPGEAAPTSMAMPVGR